MRNAIFALVLFAAACTAAAGAPVAPALDHAAVLHGRVDISTDAEGVIRISVGSEQQDETYFLQQAGAGQVVDAELARATVLVRPEMVAVRPAAGGPGWLFLLEGHDASGRVALDEYRIVEGFGLARHPGLGLPEHGSGPESVTAGYSDPVDSPVGPGATGGTTCEAGGPGSSQCSITCTTSSSCSTTCTTGYSCCYCSSNLAKCKCY